MKGANLGSPTFSFRLEPEDAKMFVRFIRRNRMNASSAVRYCLAKAGAFEVNNVEEVRDVQQRV